MNTRTQAEDRIAALLPDPHETVARIQQQVSKMEPVARDAIDDMRQQPDKFLRRAAEICAAYEAKKVGKTAVFSEATKTMQANPEMTYGQAVGYSTGVAARAMCDKFAGLSRKEWDSVTDDYAHGYRAGFAGINLETGLVILSVRHS